MIEQGKTGIRELPGFGLGIIPGGKVCGLPVMAGETVVWGFEGWNRL